MTDPQYILDANVFIEAARRYYAFDIAAGFCKGLKTGFENNKILSLDKVYIELHKGQDKLSDWAKAEISNGFISSDSSDTINAFTAAMHWVYGEKQFLDYAKSSFAAATDGCIIAHAIHSECCIVAHEVYDFQIRKKIPMPNICRQFALECEDIDTFELMRRLKINLS